MRTKPEIELAVVNFELKLRHPYMKPRTVAFLEGYLWALRWTLSDRGLNPQQQLELWDLTEEEA